MAKIKRETKETKIEVELKINTKGESEIATDVGFFNHMLESFSKHSLIDLKVDCKGDTHVDFHHCIEDVGIVMAKALKEEIYPVENIERFGEATVVMDEASVTTTLDISNRGYLHYEVDIDGKVGEFDVELTEEFFRALVINSSITAHIVLNRGKNRHHIIEAVFKSFAIALRRALKGNDSLSVPSTKGVL
jgi:imidazoleglycerol-phosphate dehydratase